MLRTDVWHKLIDKKLFCLCPGLHKKEDIFTPEIWDFHDNRTMAKTARNVISPIYEIYKILHNQLFSNKFSWQNIFELPVRSVLFLGKSVKLPFQKRISEYADI